ncbi:MAG: hypothetical protein AAF639_33920 [Chloroflexota bacterium]
MKRWYFKCGQLVLMREATLPEGDGGNGKANDSPWGAIAVFLALASLILQALSLAL